MAIPTMRLINPVAIFDAVVPLATNGRSAAASVASPMIQLKNCRGRGVEISNRCSRPVATSAAAAQYTAYSQRVRVSPGALAFGCEDGYVEDAARKQYADHRDQCGDDGRGRASGPQAAGGDRVRTALRGLNCHDVCSLSSAGSGGRPRSASRPAKRPNSAPTVAPTRTSLG